MKEWEFKDIATIISVIVTLIISLFGLLYSIRNNRKTAFINTVTSARIKYMEQIRAIVSDFCGLSMSIAGIFYDPEVKKEKLTKLATSRFQIFLLLDNTHKFDIEVINSVNSVYLIVCGQDSSSNLNTSINELIKLTHSLLRHEWNGIKEEVLKGNLKVKHKIALTEKYLTPPIL